VIRRDIRDEPEEVLADFDWFNDYKDTRRWCEHACPALVVRLDAGYHAWNAEWLAQRGWSDAR